MVSKRKLRKQEAKFGSKDYADLATLNAIKEGNKEAYTRLYKKYYPILFFKVNRCLNYANEEAKDLTQDIFIKVYENVGKYEKQYTFNSWLTALANNCIIDYVRKKKVSSLNTVSIDKLINSEDGNSGIAFELPDIHQPAPMEVTEAIAKAKGLEIIKREWKKLKPIEQQIMQMYVIDEMTYQQICDKLGIGLSMMKVTYKRAKEKIKSKLNMDQAMIEIAWTYSMEQLDVESIYNLNNEGELSCE